MPMPISKQCPINRAQGGEFLEGQFKKPTWEREEALMLAVLQDAVEYFQKYLLAKNPRGKRLFAEAEEWIMDPTRDWLFSFENICDVLQLSPDYIRLGLLRWKEAQLKSRQNGKVHSAPAGKKNRPSLSPRGRNHSIVSASTP